MIQELKSNRLMILPPQKWDTLHGLQHWLWFLSKCSEVQPFQKRRKMDSKQLHIDKQFFSPYFLWEVSTEWKFIYSPLGSNTRGKWLKSWIIPVKFTLSKGDRLHFQAFTNIHLLLKWSLWESPLRRVACILWTMLKNKYWRHKKIYLGFELPRFNRLVVTFFTHFFQCLTNFIQK